MADEDDRVFERMFADGDSLAAFRSSLVSWFRRYGRDYPWRKTSDPYAVLVSEAMLQQTRIATVIERGYYVRWMKEFPNWEALAEASEEEVLKVWEGLGYYNRARNLRKTATLVCREHGGRFPEDLKKIQTLPGVGRYTAGAVMSFAFGRKAPIVDGNVIRVISRLFAFNGPVDETQNIAKFWNWAERLTPETEVKFFNSALMELGQTHCARSSPNCEPCPVRSWCLAAARGIAPELPVKRKRRVVTCREERVLLAVAKGGVLLSPESGGRRKGLWRLPEISEDETGDLVELFRFPYSITRYRITLVVFRAAAVVNQAWVEESGAEWYALDEKGGVPPMGSPYRKALRKFFERAENSAKTGQFPGDRSGIFH